MNPQQSAPRVAILEDDPGVQVLLTRILSKSFTPRITRSGTELLAAVGAGEADIVLLDILLPGEDGIQILRRIRAQSSIPVIMLSGLAAAEHVEAGLNIGADDYVTKPFVPSVLKARIWSVLRRAKTSGDLPAVSTPKRFELPGCEVHPGERLLVGSGGERRTLTERQMAILCILGEGGLNFIPRDAISRRLRGTDWDPADRSMDVHISHIRSALAAITGGRLTVENSRGFGYRIALKHPDEGRADADGDASR